MSAKPVADKDQIPHDNVLSKFSPLNEEMGSNKHTSSFKSNDDDYEDQEMNEDEMNKKSKGIDEVMGKTAKRDGQGSTSRTKTSKKNHKEKYNDVQHIPLNARKNHKEKYDNVQIPDATLGYRRDGIELGLSDDATPQGRICF
jgi:hypothetical protein